MAAPEQDSLDSQDTREAFVLELARDLNLDIDECRRRVEADFLARDKLVSELAYVLSIDTEESWRRVAELDAAEVIEWREECAGIERDLRWLEMRAAARPPRRPVPSSRSLRMRSRESHRGRAGHRRGTRTRAGPSDDDGSEPPPPRLALAPKPGALYSYGALALDPDLWHEVNR